MKYFLAYDNGKVGYCTDFSSFNYWKPIFLSKHSFSDNTVNPLYYISDTNANFVDRIRQEVRRKCRRIYNLFLSCLGHLPWLTVHTCYFWYYIHINTIVYPCAFCRKLYPAITDVWKINKNSCCCKMKARKWRWMGK